jgi:hypothetical protein
VDERADRADERHSDLVPTLVMAVFVDARAANHESHEHQENQDVNRADHDVLLNPTSTSAVTTGDLRVNGELIISIWSRRLAPFGGRPCCIPVGKPFGWQLLNL